MRRNRKLGTVEANGVVALALVLGAGTARAVEVIPDPTDSTRVVEIRDLIVDGVAYDVTFVLQRFATEVYGEFPGPGHCDDFLEPFVPCPLPPFGTDEFIPGDLLSGFGIAEALEAQEAANAALTDEGAFSIGEIGLECPPEIQDCGNTFNIGIISWILFIPEILFAGPFEIPVITNARSIAEGNDWFPGDDDGINSVLYNGDERNYAIFTPVDGAPSPTIDLSADPETIQVGESTTISWDVLDATSCEGSQGSPGWPGAKSPVSGSEDYSPTVTSTYALTCDGPGGQSMEEVTVTVPEPGAVVSLAAALATLGAVGRWRRRESEGTA